jgi:hypothetical protein
MKKTIAIFILTGITATSCNQSDKKATQEKETTTQIDTTAVPDQHTPPADKPVSELDYLRKFAGKYPMDVKLLEDPILSPRLEKILGDRFMFVMETWAVESPIEIRGDKFIASACQAHNCGNTNFIIVANISTNKISVGVREEGKTKTYTEATTIDPIIEEWVKGN